MAGLEFEHELSVCLLSHLQRVRISTDLTVSSFQQESIFRGDSTLDHLLMRVGGVVPKPIFDELERRLAAHGSPGEKESRQESCKA